VDSRQLLLQQCPPRMMQLDELQDTTSEDLLQTWVQIIRAPVSVGHAADLRQALNRACGNSYEDPT
jgi:hypothetical protein